DRLPPVSWPVKLGVYVHGERGGATAPARCIPEAIGQAASLGVVELESAVVREQKHDHDWRLPRVKSSAVAPGASPHTPSPPPVNSGRLQQKRCASVPTAGGPLVGCDRLLVL